LTKADIVNKVAEATGITKLETEAVIDGFISTIINSLKEGQHIDIRGFASFGIKEQKAKTARNPKTGELVEVEERIVPTVKISKQLKQSVSETLKARIADHPETKQEIINQ
jgi:DNA-binding protein HU-beta